MLLALLLLLCIAFAILGLFWIYMNFRIAFLQFYKECCQYIDWNCIKPVHQFLKYGHFDNIGSAYPGTGDIVPFSDVFFQLLFIVLWFSFQKSFTCLANLIPKYLAFLDAIISGIIFLISFSVTSLLLYIPPLIYVLILYPAMLLSLGISSRSLSGRIFWVFSVEDHVVYK